MGYTHNFKDNDNFCSTRYWKDTFLKEIQHTTDTVL